MANFGQMKQYHMGPQQGAEQPPPPPPKQPRKNPYRDGITSSAQHYDLYEMIRNPAPGRAYRLPDPPTPGELYERSLSKQQRIERDVEKSFRSNNCQLPGNRFAQVGKVLKYLFFMIALPPYLLLYLLPKTLFFVLLPAGVKAVDQALVSLLNRVVNAIKSTKNKIKAACLSFWDEILKLAHTEEEESKPHEESTDFFSFIAKGFVLLYRLLISYPIAAVKFTVNSIRTLYKEIRALPAKFRAWKEAQRRKLEQFVQRVVSFPKRLLERVKASLRERFVESPKRFVKKVQKNILGKLRSLNDAVNRKGKAIEAFFKNGYAKVRSIVVNAYEFVSGGPRHWMKTVKEGKDALAKKVRQKVDEVKKRLYEAYIAPVVKAYASFKAKLAALNAAVEKRLAQIQEAAGKVRGSITLNVDYKQKIADLRGYAKQKVQPISTFAAAVKRQYGRLVVKVQEVKARMAAPFIRAGKVVDETLSATVEKCNTALEPVRVRCAAVKAKFDRAVMRVRLCVAWSRVLLRYAMRQTEELVHSFF